MRHRKEYIGDDVVLFCGDMIIACCAGRDANWQMTNCRCGMDVETTGNSPSTDHVIELVRR